MNEFIAKKLGEVLAFAGVGQETFERGNEALVQAFGNAGYKRVVDEYLEEQKKIEVFVREVNLSDVTFAKTEKTSQKLRAMRDMYIGDEWDNPIELLEWLGFFEGAAIVHWELVNASAQSHQHEELVKVCTAALNKHKNIFEQVSAAIKKLAAGSR